MSSTSKLPTDSTTFSPSSIGGKFGPPPDAAWFKPHWEALYTEFLKKIEVSVTEYGEHPEDIMLTLSRLMDWSEGEAHKQVFTRYQVPPVRGDGLNLSNEVLDYYAQFQVAFSPGGWVPVQKIGPGIVFAHFLPNMPRPNLPGFFQSHLLVDYKTYARLYKDFLHYDEDSIRKEYGLTLTAAEVTEEAVADFARMAQLLLRVANRNGPDYRKLSELQETNLRLIDAVHPSALLVGKVNHDFDIWIQSKNSELKDVVSHQLGIATVPLGVVDPRELRFNEQELDLNISPARRKWMIENQIIPIFVTGSFVLCAGPRLADTTIQHRLQDNLHSLDVFCALCTEKSLNWVLNERRREMSTEGAMELIRSTEEDVILGTPEAVDIDDSIDLQDNDSTKDFVKRVVANAIEMGASDIHLEMTGTNFRIRYRIDGILRDMYKPFRSEIAPYIVRVIKSTAGMNITESRMPLDGRMRVTFKNRAIDLRIATIPVEAGGGMSANSYEKCVIRILDSSSAPTRIEDILWNADQRETMKRKIAAPYGTIVITGPTGSGKSTTIYTLLNELNAPGVNIMTVEDPVERKLAGINQTAVTDQTTYAMAVRAHLRMDPDVILVGEVRDEETAELSIKASQTGQLVLTTLHANNAVGVVSRYRVLKVRPHDIASTVLLVTAQRLIRSLCIRCRTRVPLTGFERHQFSCKKITSVLTQNDFAYVHRGCQFCNNSGYKGRVAVMEMIDINDEIRRSIMLGEDEVQMQKLADRYGFRPLHQMGLEAVSRGVTDFAAIGELVASIGFSDPPLQIAA